MRTEAGAEKLVPFAGLVIWTEGGTFGVKT
jgi:hypothetical protein